MKAKSVAVEIDVAHGSASAAVAAGTEDRAAITAGDANTPSSEYEAAICAQLKGLVSDSLAMWARTLSISRVLLRSFLFEQNSAVPVTLVMLIISCVLYPTSQTVLCTCLFFILYALCTVLQGYFFYCRIAEAKFRTIAVMSDVIERWTTRITAMTTWRSQTPEERHRVFMQSFAQLLAKAFRMVAVVDDRTYRLKHIHKALMVKGCKRLDEDTLRVRRYLEPVGLCKLVDVMRIILESDAIVLKPLTDKAKPPRLPNLLMANKKLVEDEATTDESDNEHDTRTALGGGASISVSQHMEYFVHRVFLLLWLVGMALIVGAGIFFYFLVKAPLGEGVFLDPSVALLGLLPVNAIVLNRLLVLYANVYLDKLFRFIVSKRTHSMGDRLPRFSFIATFTTMMRVIFRVQPANGDRNPLVFSTSLVDSFGMASVIAMLDQSGIVTDMVQLPLRILTLRAEATLEGTSSDSDVDVVGYLTEKSKKDARERQREMRRQIKRKKFQEERFVELHLSQSSRDDLAVDFVDERELLRHREFVNPICLCILLHALAPKPSNLATWTEPFRFSDRTLRWVRALHWIPRACGFQDSSARRFSVLARIFQIDTKMRSGYRSSAPEQACSLLLEGEDGFLHLFSIGTPYMICQYSTTHWTGSGVEELNKKEKTEVVYMGKHQWEEGMCLETVALSHRVLPERYRRFVQTLARTKDTYSEFFFRDGEVVNEATSMARRERQAQPPQPHHDGQQGPGDVPRSAPSAVPGQVDGSRGVASAPCSPRSPPVVPPCCASDGDEPLERSGASEDDDALTLDNFVQRMATTSQTLLGLVGLRDSVRPDVQSTMSTLNDAGVRCMYFCPDNERQTRSFGSRVGLETDWNCCISLKEGAVALDHHSIRAQLPFGIKSIRKHILHVDPIPLQVHLFSHAFGVSKRAMISILQDNHEVVLAVGSVFNHSNARSFVQADLAVGVLPTRRGPNADKEAVLKHGRIVEPSDFAATNTLNRDIPLYRNVAELIGCSCALRAPPTTSILPILATMVRQARLRLSGIGNCVEFIMHANFLIVAINSISLLAGAPLLVSPIMTVFELNVIIPLLALSCTYTAYSGLDPMKAMPSHHNYFVRRAIFKHSATVWCLRYIPSLVALLALGLTASERLCKVGLLDLITKSSDVCMSSSQSYLALTLNYWLLIHCWTHISRHHPISPSLSLQLGHGQRSMYLFRSLRWVLVSLLVLVVSVLLVLAVTLSGGLAAAFVPSIPHLIVSLLFPALLLALDWPIKRWRERRFNNMQKFRKLSFGTRLGMHSPRGDYEPEGITYNTDAPPREGTEGLSSPPSVSALKRLSETFYRYTTIRDGKLELNCVCCDHIGGNYATYHVTANV